MGRVQWGSWRAGGRGLELVTVLQCHFLVTVLRDMSPTAVLSATCSAQLVKTIICFPLRRYSV